METPEWKKFADKYDISLQKGGFYDNEQYIYSSIIHHTE